MPEYPNPVSGHFPPPLTLPQKRVALSLKPRIYMYNGSNQYGNVEKKERERKEMYVTK
jgi:hypothetical protein